MPLDLPRLETARLIVRPFEMSDLEECYRLYRDIGWADKSASDADNLERRRSWGEWTVRNYQELSRLTQPPYGDRVIALKHDGGFAGLVGLVPMLGPFAQLPCFGKVARAKFSVEVGLFWAVTPAMQGRGIATEAARAIIGYAFERLNLGRIMAGTEFNNAASIAVMRRLGMRIERNPFPEPEWFQVVGILDVAAFVRG